MKLITTLLKKTYLLIIVFLITCSFFSNRASAQVCSDPINIIYGLSGAGFIYPINVNTASVGAAINPPYSGNAPSSANALGYNPANGKFYYFKRNADQTSQEFVCFDPVLSTVTILSSCPTTYSINTGCVSFDGTGFYALDANANLFRYNIVLDSWVLITSTFYDQFATDITMVFRTHNSGDIALDGFGNLWALCSSATQYGLYKFNGPLPSSTVGSLTGVQIINPNTPTPNHKNFAGIAFNTTGQIYISGGTGDDNLYRLENNLTLTHLGLLNITGAGRDLTSCSFPFQVLPLTWKNFAAALESNHRVLLNWEVEQQMNNKEYSIEHSLDGRNWKEIGVIPSNGNHSTSVKYSFTHFNISNGNNFYRIRQIDYNGNSIYSEIKMVTIKTTSQLAVWPNPAKEVIHILTPNNSLQNGFTAQFFDLSGRVVNESVIQPGVNSVDIHLLPTGTYIIRVRLSNGEAINQKLIKQ